MTKELKVLKAKKKFQDLQELVLEGNIKVIAYKQPEFKEGDLVRYTPQPFGCAAVTTITL